MADVPAPPQIVQRTASIASYLPSISSIRPNQAAETVEDDVDGTPQQSLTQAVHSRRSEFTRPQSVRVKVGSWNVAAKSGTEKDVGGWFVGGKGISLGLTGLEPSGSRPSSSHATEEEVHEAREGVEEQEKRRSKKDSTLPLNDEPLVSHDEEVGIYALGLQEVVDITSPVEAMKPYTDPGVARKYKQAMEEALPEGYVLVAEQQLMGLLILVWAAPEVAPHVGSVSTTSVGTGLMGYMGNKGGVVARIVLGESTRLAFVNSHMAAGNGKTELERRNWDASQIVSRTKFEPIVDSLGVSQSAGSERLGDEDFGFWFGDLNYRLEGIPGDDVRRILMLHARNEYDIGSRQEAVIEKEIERMTKDAERQSLDRDPRASTLSGSTLATFEERGDPADDPASLQATLNSLLPHDELHQMQKAGKAFHDGWREGPITFLPTYKYDVGSVGVFDTGEKRRAPSWCDRILYRTRRDVSRYWRSVREDEASRKKDEELKSRGVETAVHDENSMLFEYDPDADGDDDQDAASSNGDSRFNISLDDGGEDTIVLENYVSHQRVLSSDHKPLSAIFTIKYDAVQPEMRAKIHHEVAWEIDRAENEGRPSLVVVVDGVQDDNARDFHGVSFGPLRFMDTRSRSITLANTGRSPARFGFVAEANKLDARWVSSAVELPVEHFDGSKSNGKTPKSLEEWAKDVPVSFTLQPGETCNLHLTAHVEDIGVVRQLSTDLEDVLVLRVQEGRDHFIPAHASWQRTCHGLSIDQLIRVPEGGIRKFDSSKDDAVRWSAPREIFRLTEAIETRVERIVAEASMVSSEDEPWNSVAGWPFVEESWSSKDQALRSELLIQANEALDTDEAFDQHLAEDATPLQKLEALAETLLLFLRNLEDGVITTEIWTQLENSFFVKTRGKLSNDEQRSAILEILHAFRAHSVTFVLLTSMLIRITRELSGSSTGSEELPTSPKLQVKRKALDADPAVARRQLMQKNFAAAFADVLIRTTGDARSKKAASTEQRRELLMVFLEHDVA